MVDDEYAMKSRSGVAGTEGEATLRMSAEEALLKAGALQRAIFNSANFSSIATDAKGVIQIFNVGAERMLGYTAAEVVNKITPADISDPAEVITRAKALSAELATPITPGFEALVFKASRGIEDIYELTYIRKDGSRFPAVVSVTALRDAQDAIIGYLLIGTDNTIAAPEPSSTASVPSSATPSWPTNASSFMSSDTVNPMPPSAPAPHNCRHEYASGFAATPEPAASRAASTIPTGLPTTSPSATADISRPWPLNTSADQATPALASAKTGSTT